MDSAVIVMQQMFSTNLVAGVENESYTSARSFSKSRTHEGLFLNTLGQVQGTELGEEGVWWGGKKNNSPIQPSGEDKSIWSDREEGESPNYKKILALSDSSVWSLLIQLFDFISCTRAFFCDKLK